MQSAEAPVTALFPTQQKNRTNRTWAVRLALFLILPIFGVPLYLLCVTADDAFRPVTRFTADSTGLLLPRDPLVGEIDINSATAEELQALPGIGPKYSADIVAYRQACGGFRYPEDLLEVRGIAAKRYAALLPYITLGEYTTQVTSETP